MHVYFLEILKTLGMMEDYEEWQNLLIDLVEEVDMKYSSNPNYPLWDFSGYNTVTMDEVPPAGSSNLFMDWYYDVGHFKKKLGDRIQDRIFNYNDARRVLPEDFGMQINSKNINFYQHAQRNVRMRYLISHQREIKELDSRVKAVKKKIGKFDCGTNSS